MIDLRSSPGSRERSSFEISAKRRSAVSSSSRSSGVIFVAATSVASDSSSARTMNASCSSSRESVRTRTPRFGTNETRPSAASRRSASRTGVRETWNCSESCSWRRTVPGASSPETIASSITSAMSSAFVESRLISAPGAGKAGASAPVSAPAAAKQPPPRPAPSSLRSFEMSVRREREELLELLGEREPEEELLRLGAGLHALGLGANLFRRETARPDPLPDLRARDLRGRRVLHQVVDRRSPDAVQPRIEVPDADRDVRPEALLGDLARRLRDREQRRLVQDDVLAQPLELVRPVAEHGVELLRRDRNEIGMGDPRPVEALPGLAFLVLAHLRERDPVDLRVPARRDEGGHAADRVRAAPVTRAHE